jgi:hypothetical protein
MVNAKKKRNRLLDLDALNLSIGDVKVGGNKYKVFQPAYEDFVLMPILFDSLGNFEDITGEDIKEEKMSQVTQMREIIKRIIPDLNQNILTIPQLMSIVEFVSEGFADQMEDQYGTSEDGKGK